MKCRWDRHPRNTAQMSRPVLVLNLENFKRGVASRSPAATFLGMAGSLRNWSDMAIRIISVKALPVPSEAKSGHRSHMITQQGFFHKIQLKYLANSGFSWLAFFVIRTMFDMTDCSSCMLKVDAYFLTIFCRTVSDISYIYIYIFSVHGFFDVRLKKGDSKKNQIF